MEYVSSFEKQKIDAEFVHRFLTNSYWAKGISLETVKQSIDNSLVIGMYKNDKQVGFARVITDSTTMAYLADVFVDSSHQGRGLAQKMLTDLFEHDNLQGLRRVLLATSDAHDLYKKFGFTSLAQPEIMMEINKPNIYQRNAIGS
jgi:N-acetylglutamate synthase-like GNAT family acetyltransferase